MSQNPFVVHTFS